MNLKRTLSAALAFALLMTPAFVACSPDDNKTEIDTPDNPENPEPEPETLCYTLLTSTRTNWEGDWIISYIDGDEIYALNSGDAEKGMCYAKKIDGYTPSSEIPTEIGDKYKAVFKKDGEGYIINIAGIGYIGSSGDKRIIFSKSDVAGNVDYRWTITFDNGFVNLKPVNQDKTLQYNVSASCFRFYTSGQKMLKMFMRSVSDGEIGGGNKPEPEPNPEPEPKPEPEPEPEPSEPSVTTGAKWFELPAINSMKKGTRYLVDKENSDLYYAYHLCNGPEKYAHNGKRARNYTVCFSASHHCPVWVAAIRHNSLHPIGEVDRTNSYRQDPDIPTSIQYNSKAIGGGCNKGHMLGSNERTSSTATNRQVFYYSNIAPQDSDGFNTGGAPWNTLEGYVDKIVPQDSLYMVIGCYFDDYTDVYGKTQKAKRISFGGRSDVSMPTMFYYALLRTKKGNLGKSVIDCSADELMCVAYVLRHETAAKQKGNNYKLTAKDLMSISDLEKLTGFKYFVNVPNAPKNTFKASDWGL